MTRPPVPLTLLEPVLVDDGKVTLRTKSHGRSMVDWEIDSDYFLETAAYVSWMILTDKRYRKLENIC